MQYRHELSAIIAATAIAGGPLVVLGEVLGRRAKNGEGLSPAEVQAAARLVAAARHLLAGEQTAATATPRAANAN
jgi:hypothetical protein